MLYFPLLEVLRLQKDRVWENRDLKRKKKVRQKTKKLQNLELLWKTHQIFKNIQGHDCKVPQLMFIFDEQASTPCNCI